MKIWVDADSCPVTIKEMIFKAANRTKIHTTLLANHYMKIPPSPYLQFSQVSQGFDVADDEIVARGEKGDLVITSAIPLAAEVIEKGAQALSSRGELFTTENIGGRLIIRDFMDTMRSSGIQSGGPPPLGPQDKQKFANEFDKIIAKAGLT
jgi:uncharacterized protein YaiI (UPF0178 family)